MERIVLQAKDSNGNRVDAIPYVDALAVKIGGSNLQEYMSQVNASLEKLSLFKGPFESEEVLLTKYPEGEKYPEGLIAIVSDSDSIYLYDTETLKWIKTSSNISGIFKLNGLTAINGILTLTGGNIDATIPNAETPTQSITNHLNYLYSMQKVYESQTYGLVSYDYGWADTTIDDNYVTYHAKVYAQYKNSKFLVMELRAPEGMTSDQYNKLIKIDVTYSDGTTKTNTLYSADKCSLRYRDLVKFLSVNLSMTEPYVIIYYDTISEFVSLLGITKNSNNRITATYSIKTNNWVENEDGTGYTYTITADESSFTSTYNVLNIYKTNGSKRTTAIIDYVIENNIITLCSDEAFDGGVVVTYLYY